MLNNFPKSSIISVHLRSKRIKTKPGSDTAADAEVQDVAVSNIGAAVEAVAVAEDVAAEDLLTFIAAAEVSSRIRTRTTRTITAQTFRIKVTIRVVVFDRITTSIVTRTEDSAEDKTTFKAEGHQDEFQQVEYLNKLIKFFITRGDERLQRRDRLKQRDCQR